MIFLLEEAQNSGSIYVYVLLGVLFLFVIFSLFTNTKKRTAYLEQLKEQQKKYVVGTKVKTYAGIYGEIVAVREALDGSKVVTLKCGEGNNAMTFEIDINGISNIDDKDNKEVFDEEYAELKQKMEETSKTLTEKQTMQVDQKEEENTDSDVFATTKKKIKDSENKEEE